METKRFYGAGSLKCESVGHEEVDVAQRADDADVGGNEALVALPKLEHLGLAPDAVTHIGINMLAKRFSVFQLNGSPLAARRNTVRMKASMASTSTNSGPISSVHTLSKTTSWLQLDALIPRLMPM